MFGRKKGSRDYPEMVDSIQGSPKEEPAYERKEENYNSYLMEQEEWPEDMKQWEDAESRQEEAPAVGAARYSIREEAGEDEAAQARRQEEKSEEAGKPQEPDPRDLARMERRKRRKRELRRVRLAAAVFVLAVLGVCAAAGVYILEERGIAVLGSEGLIARTVGSLLPGNGQDSAGEGVLAGGTSSSQQEEAADFATEAQAQSETPETEPETVIQTESPEEAQARAALIAQADLKAAQYDYDGALELLRSHQDFGTNAEMQQKSSEYEAAKAACVEISPDTVSHIFVHSLIVDTSRAFDGDAAQDGYNLNMVTVDEFRKILQSLYDNGYVLVSLHDMGEIDENGTMQRKTIRLPEGKKPLVFSQDDVSYYHSYAGDGFADRLIVDENGQVKNEYTDASGNTTVGDYDMVPILDAFVQEHPDFSYHGRKGIIALTGYNGVLGYRTDGDYRDQVSLQEDQRKWLSEHPEYDFDADVAAATRVAEAMKANGWEFASHTWGHISVSDRSLEDLQRDTQKWLDYVEPIVGETDMIIFAFGADIGDWTGYASDNAKFSYLKSAGFDYYCNVDGSTLNWVQFGETYLRQSRMNVDGYRMATNPEILSPLFDVSAVYDSGRPAMSEWTQ